MNLRVALAVPVVSALVLAGCHSSPEPTPSPTSSSPAPSATASPTPTATAAQSPTPTPTPAPTWSIPSGWTDTDPAAAGVDSTTVDAVLGAWELPGGGIASVVVVRNDAGTTDPDVYFDATFADLASQEDFTVTHESRTTDAGEPALVVTVTPVDESAGDAQQFIVVLKPRTVTWASVSDDPKAIDASAAALWGLMRSLPAS